MLKQSPNIKITCSPENGLPYTVFGHFERFPLIHLLTSDTGKRKEPLRIQTGIFNPGVKLANQLEQRPRRGATNLVRYFTTATKMWISPLCA